MIKFPTYKVILKTFFLKTLWYFNNVNSILIQYMQEVRFPLFSKIFIFFLSFQVKTMETKRLIDNQFTVSMGSGGYS